ncbi:MAG: hypothetical protein ACJA08_003385 [Cyclobacteriaceae bacterium]|jgi:hypothetical protein
MENIRKFQIINSIISILGLGFIAFGFWIFTTQNVLFISLLTTFLGCAMSLPGILTLIDLWAMEKKIKPRN